MIGEERISKIGGEDGDRHKQQTATVRAKERLAMMQAQSKAASEGTGLT